MENAENVPKGEYLSSCGGCTYNEGTRELKCKCLKGNDYVETMVQTYDKCEIINERGTLKCRETPKEVRDVMTDENAKPKEDPMNGYHKLEL